MLESFFRRGGPAAPKPGLRRTSVATTPHLRDIETLLIPAPGVRLAVIGDARLLFVPEREGMFETEQVVADLWPSVQSGISVQAFCDAAAAAGHEGPALVEALRGAGALAVLGNSDGPAPVQSRMVIDLGSLCLGVNFSDLTETAALRDLASHLETPPRACDRQLIVRAEGDHVGFALHGQMPDRYPLAQAAPGFKVAMTDAALGALEGIALHVATLSRGDEALLLVGEPGAGKSTLSVALGAAGFRLDGDDVAALLPDGRVTALPFPCTVKDGSWAMVAPFRPDLPDRAAHLRPDGQRVRYLPLDPSPPAPRRVRTVLCLERAETAPARLRPMAVQQAVAALLADAWSASKRLAPRDFDALTACVRGASFHRLTYRALDQAVALARSAWEGPSGTVTAR